ncbi:MAG: retropepsin-like domain-containing protein [Prolixibacteraceae bacterium]|nr:retropepsin-like domain-containing protein [Prolixibacteraceae bacterium]
MQKTIPFELIALEENNYHITVYCKFDNDDEGMWVIDTGASKTVFDQTLEHLYSPLEVDDSLEIKSSGIGGARLETTLGKLHAFALGDLRMEPMQVALIDLSHINELYYNATDKKICGLIGSDFLLKHKAVINYETQELILQTEDL